MSEDKPRVFDRSRLKTYPLSSRKSKVATGEFAKPPRPDSSFKAFVDSLPSILAGRTFRDIVAALRSARLSNRPVLFAMGAHPIKCGLNPVLIDGMERGWLTALALNGAGVIHDFEIALMGTTSEDVKEQITDGTFGMAEETGRMINEAFANGVAKGWGLGHSMGHFLAELKPRYGEHSLLAAAHRLGVPVTVHVAVGTDIIHMHPSASGSVLGEGSMRDFLSFTETVSELEGGGVYMNVGSAVILPEVFLKAVAMVRNAGRRLADFTTVSLDFLQMYRPSENVVKRPVTRPGRGYALTGHHEILIPLIAFALAENTEEAS